MHTALKIQISSPVTFSFVGVDTHSILGLFYTSKTFPYVCLSIGQSARVHDAGAE